MDKIVFRGAQVLYAGQFIEADVAVASQASGGIWRETFSPSKVIWFPA